MRVGMPSPEITRRVGELEAENRTLRQLPAGNRSISMPHGYTNAPLRSREPERRPFDSTLGPDVTPD